MKKVITLILALFYLATSFGATVNMHYCMGEFVEISIGSKQSNICSGCGMLKKDDKGKDCCKNEHKQLKHEKHRVSSQLKFIFFQIAGTPPGSLWLLHTIDETELTHGKFFDDYPLQKKTIPLFLLNSIFRI